MTTAAVQTTMPVLLVEARPSSPMNAALRPRCRKSTFVVTAAPARTCLWYVRSTASAMAATASVVSSAATAATVRLPIVYVVRSDRPDAEPDRQHPEHRRREPSPSEMSLGVLRQNESLLVSGPVSCFRSRGRSRSRSRGRSSSRSRGRSRSRSRGPRCTLTRLTGLDLRGICHCPAFHCCDDLRRTSGRREWDSNPRRLAPRSFSRAVHSSALPSLPADHAR